jgi:hypothetical protein
VGPGKLEVGKKAKANRYCPKLISEQSDSKSECPDSNYLTKRKRMALFIFVIIIILNLLQTSGSETVPKSQLVKKAKAKANTGSQQLVS